jgi:glyoxylase-like metal-dependent hydrolase (beta-lactamase superfamily II)
MQIGRFNVRSILFGRFRLDGGAMFGVVPKNIWAKRLTPDAENCIPLAARCLCIRDETRCVLVDTGFGAKWKDSQTRIYGFELTSPDKLGVAPEEVTDIILTHLHFDHAGGISYFDRAGELQLAFPDARIYLQQANFETALRPNARERASYLKENVEVLKRARLTLLEGESEILPGVFVHRTDGHTEGHQWVEVADEHDSLFFAADLIPTAHHLPLAYHMGYDICVQKVLQEKEVFLNAALARQAVVAFQHDAHTEAVTLKAGEAGGALVSEVLSLS